jgi:hypothetical protein
MEAAQDDHDSCFGDRERAVWDGAQQRPADIGQMASQLQASKYEPRTRHSSVVAVDNTITSTHATGERLGGRRK